MKTPLYFSKSGEAAVTSELLLRGYNVAAPATDIGDDLYAVNDSDGTMTRIQVKSALCKKRRYGCIAHISVKLAHLVRAKSTPLIYIFALRFEDAWQYLAIRCERLAELYELHQVGELNPAKNNIWFRLKFFSEQNTITCSGYDMTNFLGWGQFAPLFQLSPSP